MGTSKHGKGKFVEASQFSKILAAAALREQACILCLIVLEREAERGEHDDQERRALHAGSGDPPPISTNTFQMQDTNLNFLFKYRTIINGKI